ncbi:MAG: TlpA family protein disulfide reductase [Gemmatimonadetes bacterium]|nr:TlpA family protein disulfide reductase [Gemmatimonadota bacterium]MYH51388.1 TlpA family protein disulfide reductase [Gemmatimonadota bacterium]MYK64932.1 TlpA family protein disulfide reductase [Gemmatimonadota bacterium]
MITGPRIATHVESTGPPSPRAPPTGRPRMRKSAAVATALIVSSALVFLVSRAVNGPSTAGADVAIDIPAAALTMWYPPVQEFDNGGELLEDGRFDALMAALDEAMTAEETLADPGRSIYPNVQGFIRRIAIPWLSDEQTGRASAYLTSLVDRFPEHERQIRRQISALEYNAPARRTIPSFWVSVQNHAYPGSLYPEDGSFADEHIDRRLAGLHALLELPETLNDLEREAGRMLRNFTQLLQAAEVNDEQADRIIAYFDAVAGRHPELAEMIDEQRRYVEYLLPGRVARNIVGTDLEGVEFSLEDYRGNIVVLVFSGQWCGPCREEYPYHSFALEHYRDDPVVFLGVNSDPDIETMRDAKANGEAPAYRSWWDESTEGPIATDWQVAAWPSIHVLDPEGVIRHTNTRGAGLIMTLDEMLADMRRAESGQAASLEDGRFEALPYPDDWSPDGWYFTDEQIDGMLGALDAILGRPETVEDIERNAGPVFADFTARLQTGRISDEQTERVLAWFDAFVEDHPVLAQMVDERRRYMEHLIPGRVARNIVGKDLGGVEFSLEDYRGSVVVLVFSGEWCGPCRDEYPYHRFAMELYKDDPVVFLGVNSDADIETILASKARGEAPDYRAWWDGHGQPDAEGAAADGPIARAWNVRGWPSVFMIDQDGVIRYINKRGGELIQVLDWMVMEVRRAGFEPEGTAG